MFYALDYLYYQLERFKIMMNVHICTFQIRLMIVKSLSSKFTDGQSIEAVWRNQKGQIIVVGKAKPFIKQAVALFDQPFQMQTDLLRDPANGLYHSTLLLLEIRRTGQPLNEKISSSICSFDLANVLVKRSIPEKSYTSQDKSFEVTLSINCIKVQETGIQKKLKVQKSKGEGSQASSLQKIQSNQDLHNSSRSGSRSRKMSRQNSREKKPVGQGDLLQQINQLKEELKKNQVQHIYTQQKLYITQNQYAEQENVINQLSAQITQLQTGIIEANNQIKLNEEQIAALTEENGRLVQKIIDMQNHKFKFQQNEKENYQKTIEQLRRSLKKQNESQAELRKSIGKQKQISLFLTKNIDQLKRDFSKSQEQKQILAKNLKTTQQERDIIRNRYNKQTGEFKSVERRTLQDLKAMEKKYDILFEQYTKMKRQMMQFDNMVNKKQLEAQISFYQTKIMLYQKKEADMKEHAEEIEKNLTIFQEILQEKEGNEQILIEHSRKLQLEIDSINYQKGWWEKLLIKDDMEEKSSMKNGKTPQSEQIVMLKDRVKQLMKILQKNAKFLLQSQKNKREISVLQRELEEHSRRQMQQRQEMKQLKERVKVLLNQNKKIFTRTNQVSKQNQSLTKTNKRQSIELENFHQREQRTQKDIQILNFRIEALEKQIIRLNDVLNKKNQQLEQNEIQNIPLSLPQNSELQPQMDIIKQEKQDFNSSNVMSHKHSQSEVRGVRQFQVNIMQNFTDLFRKREGMLDELRVHIAEIIQVKTSQSFQTLSQELRKLMQLVTKIKITLMRAGQRESIKDIQLTVKKISQQINSVKTFSK